MIGVEVSPFVDVTGLASSLSSSSVSGNVDVGVLKLLQNLDRTVASQLAASIGLGTAIDAYA
jgi:hypothetical protein